MADKQIIQQSSIDHFREALTQFAEEVKNCVTVNQLGELFIETTDSVLPLDRIGLFTMQKTSMRLRLTAHQGFDLLQRHSVPFESEQLKSELRLPVALEGRVDPTSRFEPADAGVFQRWGIEVVFPIMESQKEILGFLVLGKKISGQPYSNEEMNFLSLLSTQSAIMMAKLMMQEKLVLQGTENDRLEELNELKSIFVSCVSHELKTPLTSIKIMSELIQSDEDLTRDKIQQYAEVIEGESDRLTRLINNILDISKIEREAKMYSFARVDLNEIVDKAVAIMKYQLEMERFNLRSTRAKEPLNFNGDGDAVCSATINLISNAMKYSREEKIIDIYTYKREDSVGVTIADRGCGIREEERIKIFDEFYRSKDVKAKSSGGMGIGLTIVKHVVDAHNGKIQIFSEVGEETKFALMFPILGKESKQNDWDNIGQRGRIDEADSGY